MTSTPKPVIVAAPPTAQATFPATSAAPSVPARVVAPSAAATLPTHAVATHNRTPPATRPVTVATVATVSRVCLLQEKGLYQARPSGSTALRGSLPAYPY